MFDMFLARCFGSGRAITGLDGFGEGSFSLKTHNCPYSISSLGLGHKPGFVLHPSFVRDMELQGTHTHTHIYTICNQLSKEVFEVKLPTIWTDEKQRWSRRIEKRRAEERRSEKRKGQKKEDTGARKGKKVAKHCFSNDLWLQRVEK